MDNNTEYHSDEYDLPPPPPVFNKEFDSNIINKISDSSSFTSGELDEGYLSNRFDSRTFKRPINTSHNVSDVRAVEHEEFHDASPDREIVAVASDSPVDNLSKAAPSNHHSNVTPVKKPETPNGIDNVVNINTNTQHITEKTYTDEQVNSLIESARAAERLKIQANSAAVQESVKMGSSETDNSMETKIISEINKEYAELLITQSKRTEDILSKQIKKLSTDNSVLLKELDVMHSAMSDLHKRYDRARGIINQMKKREDTLEEEIKQLQEELRNSEDNCRFISKTCDEKLEDASNRVELIQMEKEKDRVMMEASIKRLELENSSWQSKFRDKENSERELIAICDSLMAVKEQEVSEA